VGLVDGEKFADFRSERKKKDVLSNKKVPFPRAMGIRAVRSKSPKGPQRAKNSGLPADFMVSSLAFHPDALEYGHASRPACGR
jgi:hypothetical protein